MTDLYIPTFHWDLVTHKAHLLLSTFELHIFSFNSATQKSKSNCSDPQMQTSLTIILYSIIKHNVVWLRSQIWTTICKRCPFLFPPKWNQCFTMFCLSAGLCKNCPTNFPETRWRVGAWIHWLLGKGVNPGFLFFTFSETKTWTIVTKNRCTFYKKKRKKKV